jgi:large subunit ribosomal protein L11
MADKKVKHEVKIVIQAGKAQAGASLGSTLGPLGINLMQFCKEFNDATGSMAGAVPALISVYDDRTFTFILKTPPVAELIKIAAGIPSGSSDPLRKKVGKITQAQVLEIAEKKIVDLNCYTVDQAAQMIRGTARSMGVQVETA